MNLGSQIKKYRSELSMSQDELAEKVFVSRQSVSNWENGKSYPDLLTLVKISNDFKYSLDSMLKENPNMTETMNQNMKHGESSVLIGGISAILLFIITVEMIALNYGSKFTWIIFFFVIFINAGNVNIFWCQLKKQRKTTKILLLLFCLVFAIISFGVIYYIR